MRNVLPTPRSQAKVQWVHSFSDGEFNSRLVLPQIHGVPKVLSKRCADEGQENATFWSELLYEIWKHIEN